ncbi:uncharacterized protein LOC143897005 [Temnothorax americanus]|uniref:uncharacterized protein LOC143897005 n=1 Tax=Temnothorax americanus TaxID=1964332 RepID=UPI0040680EED
MASRYQLPWNYNLRDSDICRPYSEMNFDEFVDISNVCGRINDEQWYIEYNYADTLDSKTDEDVQDNYFLAASSSLNLSLESEKSPVEAEKQSSDDDRNDNDYSNSDNANVCLVDSVVDDGVDDRVRPNDKDIRDADDENDEMLRDHSNDDDDDDDECDYADTLDPKTDEDVHDNNYSLAASSLDLSLENEKSSVEAEKQSSDDDRNDNDYSNSDNANVCLVDSVVDDGVDDRVRSNDKDIRDADDENDEMLRDHSNDDDDDDECDYTDNLDSKTDVDTDEDVHNNNYSLAASSLDLSFENEKSSVEAEKQSSDDDDDEYNYADTLDPKTDEDVHDNYFLATSSSLNLSLESEKSPVEAEKHSSDDDSDNANACPVDSVIDDDNVDNRDVQPNDKDVQDANNEMLRDHSIHSDDDDDENVNVCPVDSIVDDGDVNNRVRPSDKDVCDADEEMLHDHGDDDEARVETAGTHTVVNDDKSQIEIMASDDEDSDVDELEYETSYANTETLMASNVGNTDYDEIIRQTQIEKELIDAMDCTDNSINEVLAEPPQHAQFKSDIDFESEWVHIELNEQESTAAADVAADKSPLDDDWVMLDGSSN